MKVFEKGDLVKLSSKFYKDIYNNGLVIDTCQPYPNFYVVTVYWTKEIKPMRHTCHDLESL